MTAEPVPPSAADHGITDAHQRSVGGGSESIRPPTPKGCSTPSAADQTSRDAQRTCVGGCSESTFAAPPMSDPTPSAADVTLLVLADILDDLERTRIANQNRLRSLISDEDWGKGVPSELPEARLLTSIVEQLGAIEHGAELALRRAMRKHPLGPWQKRTIGVGDKQLARLLAVIGDPGERPNVAKLWAFCGLHVEHADQQDRDAQCSIVGVAPRRRRGEKANWSTLAKMRVYLIAESCMKNRQSPYRPLYDAGREKYAESVHGVPCPRCGPKGKPAPEGSPLSLGHQHARAMRLVMKAILRDLWVEARAMSVPMPMDRTPSLPPPQENTA